MISQSLPQWQIRSPGRALSGRFSTSTVASKTGVPTAAERLAQDLLRPPGPVHLGGIDVGQSGVETGADRRDRWSCTWHRSFILLPQTEARRLRIAVAVDHSDLIAARKGFSKDLLPYLILLATAALGMGLYLVVHGRDLVTPDACLGIVSLELPVTADRAAAVIASWYGGLREIARKDI